MGWHRNIKKCSDQLIALEYTSYTSVATQLFSKAEPLIFS